MSLDGPATDPQAHHLDLEFYDRFYKSGTYTEAHRHHWERWHAPDGGAR